jgi:hypothetical protein
LDGRADSFVGIDVFVGVCGGPLITITEIAIAITPRMIDARVIFLFISCGLYR